MKSVHLNLKCTFLCTIWLSYICLILCLFSWIKQKKYQTCNINTLQGRFLNFYFRSHGPLHFAYFTHLPAKRFFTRVTLMSRLTMPASGLDLFNKSWIRSLNDIHMGGMLITANRGQRNRTTTLFALALHSVDCFVTE